MATRPLYLSPMPTATASETFGPAELAQIHAACWRFSTILNGDRWDEMWRSLDEETRDRIKAKARWEGVTLSGVIHEWWPDLAQDSAVICLYKPRDNADGQYIVGYADADGATLMRTKRSWQHKYHPTTKLDADEFLVEIEPERYVPLRAALELAA